MDKRKQIKLPESIYQALKALAKKNGRSMVRELEKLIQEKEQENYGKSILKALNL